MCDIVVRFIISYRYPLIMGARRGNHATSREQRLP